MPRLHIGITLETLGQPLRTALVTAAQGKIQGMVFDATGPLGPDQLSETGRRELRHLFRSYNLSISGLRCPLRRGLDELDGLETRLERIRKAMDLAFDLGPGLILLGIGTIPPEATDPIRERLKNALNELTRHGDRIGCRVALDVGLEPAEVLCGFIGSFDTGSLCTNVDPATLLMEKLPLESTVAILCGTIGHVYARDAVPRRLDRAAREVPLGHGDIDWFAWLGALEQANYAGPLTIRQAPFTDPPKQTLAAVQFLHRLGVGAP